MEKIVVIMVKLLPSRPGRTFLDKVSPWTGVFFPAPEGGLPVLPMQIASIGRGAVWMWVTSAGFLTLGLGLLTPLTASWWWTAALDGCRLQRRLIGRVVEAHVSYGRMD